MKFNFALAVVSALMFSTPSHALQITINPSSDGSLYVCEGCNTVSDGNYVLASGYIQGVVKFSTASITGNVSQALLTLNPYGLPLWGTNLEVYGYGTTTGALVDADANAGTLLGTLSLPDDLGYGEDAYFDVTSFVTTVNTPYIAFNLRSSDTDVFSSLEYNYGHPSQLLISTVPEPASLALITAGLLGLGARRVARKSTRHNRA